MISEPERMLLKLRAERGNQVLRIERPITEPYIVRNHIDGPYVGYLDGQMRWLTWCERIMVRLGRLDAWDLELKRGLRLASPTLQIGDGE